MKCKQKFGIAMSRKSLLIISTLICLLGQSVVSADRRSLKSNIPMKSHQQKARLISFDSNTGKVDISLDLSVPFLSLPLADRNAEPGEPPMPLVNVNTKALVVFGTLMAISTFILPLFVKKVPEIPIRPSVELYHHHGKEHKRTDRGLDFGFLEDSLNEILFRNSHVTPCLQRIVCSAVASASHKDNPTSTDKIVDGLSRHRWFEQVANHTVVEEAIMKGHEVSKPEDCIVAYEGCALDQEFIANILKIIGI